MIVSKMGDDSSEESIEENEYVADRGSLCEWVRLAM